VENDKSYSVTLIDAYPVSVNQLDLDWSNDSYHKLTVTFAYTKWKNNSLEALAMEFVDSVIGNVSDRLGGLGGTTGGAIGSITGGLINGSGIGLGPKTPNNPIG
jgi:hypothetical protein